MAREFVVGGDERASADNSVRVLICDDHALYRRGLIMVLEDATDIEVVAEAENGKQAVAMARRHAPDVILMDVSMPGIDGVEAAGVVTDVLPGVPIVMLTVSESEEDLLAAMKNGAVGYLAKEASITEVADAVRAVVGGGTLISPAMASLVLQSLPRADDGSGPHRLTPREESVLGLVAEGRPSDDVASELGLSVNAVRNHLRNVLEKLRRRSRNGTSDEPSEPS